MRELVKFYFSATETDLRLSSKVEPGLRSDAYLLKVMSS